MKVLAFVAYGIPQPKGSAQAFIPKGWTRAVVTSDNRKNKPWQLTVAQAAQAAIAADRRFRPLAGAVTLTVEFHLPRPQRVKADEPHLTSPDLDKLCRSVGDALTGVAWHDDAQVDMLVSRKGYAAPGTLPRAEITVHPTTGGLTW